MTGRAWTALRNPGVLGAAGLSLGLAATWYLVGVEPEALPVVDLIAFLAAAVAGELLYVSMPRGRGLPLAAAVVALMALLGHPPHLVATVAVFGWVAAGVVRRLRGMPVRSSWGLRSVAFGLLVPGLAGLGTRLSDARIDVADGNGVMTIGAGLLVSIGVIVALPLLVSLTEIARTQRSALVTLREAVMELSSAAAAIASTAVVAALVYPALGPVTLLAAFIPLLAARLGLEQYSQITHAFDQTTRAISDVPERFGRTEVGHNRRVNMAAQELAAQLGLSIALRHHLERAAALHEVGHIKFEPGETVDDPTVAESSSKIVRQADGTDETSGIIAAQFVSVLDSSVMVESVLAGHILRAACQLDRGVDPSEVCHELDAMHAEPRLTHLVSDRPRRSLVVAGVGGIWT